FSSGILDVEEKTPLYLPVADADASRVKGRYVRLIASIKDGDRIQFFLDTNQKDAVEGAPRGMALETGYNWSKLERQQGCVNRKSKQK
ncbi:hypothetical protein BGZ95_007103, partial [Linnemannia exigua]